MMQIIVENAGTIAVTIGLAAMVVGIIIKLHKDRKQGRSSCGGNCGACPMAGKCH